MPNYKNIRIIVNGNSWANNKPPASLLAIPNIRKTDIDLAFIHTALWTRPPSYLGFDLSDWWAWLRYSRAFDTSDDLRLREEWNDIDPHQKMILSDELGVGFTTQLFAELLGFILYVDTNFMINMLMPEAFQLGLTSKRGPRKAPDYVALDAHGNFHVLECKGTQTSLEELNNAILRGVPQKRNLSTSNSTNIKINYSLVAGLFIPQYSNPNNATIQISDPDRDDLSMLLEKASEKDFISAIIQISFAKHFALMGLYKISNELISTVTKELKRISKLDEGDIESLLSQNNSLLTFKAEYPLPPEEKAIHKKAKKIRFQMDYPYEYYQQLISYKNIYESFYAIGLRLKDHRWISETQEDKAQLISPLGFKLSLSYI
jgi:hypothetical protein